VPCAFYISEENAKEENAKVDSGFIFDLNPIITTIGPLQLRYYGLIFAAMLGIGFLLWRWQMLRGGHSSDLARKFFIWGVIAVLAGSRLGHCLFYEPERYLADPISILFLWQSGLASHGATVGLVLAILGFSLKHRLPFVAIMDRFSMSAAVGATMVRLGNFFNSEIVGRATDVPWAVQFVIYDRMMGIAPTPRHPSQLYEFVLGIFVLVSLYLADRGAGQERRPVGLLSGMFLTLYFGGRFFIEFFKEYQTDLRHAQALTMGQYLSIIPFIAGVVLLLWSFTKGKSIKDGHLKNVKVLILACF
jgi:prolipoprotein diacylglyceryl transferase